MTESTRPPSGPGAAPRAALRAATGFAADVANGLLQISLNSFALIGFALVGALAFGSSQPEMRHDIEARALSWLQARQPARAPAPTDAAADDLIDEPDAIARATAIDPKELSRQQGSVALWLSRRYRVALEPVARLVQEAWQAGARSHLDPTLILAIMAVESSFNPFAQSAVGAQGLMQVMTRVHDAKYEAFGGSRAAFDPVTNVRVGVQVLKECIARAGSVEGGLRLYVGAGNLADDGGYAGKVLSEQTSLRQVAGSQGLPPAIVPGAGLQRVSAGLPVALEPAQALAPAAAASAESSAPAAAPPATTAEPKASEQIALLH